MRPALRLRLRPDPTPAPRPAGGRVGHARRRGAAAALGLALLAPLLPGCATSAVASYNLDVLMDSEDDLRHLAPIKSGWNYYLNSLADLSFLREESILRGGAEGGVSEVGDPSYEALKYLLELEEGDGWRGERVKEIELVRQFARYGARCPGRLARERSLLALPEHAQRLGVTEPIREPRLAANAPELGEALRGLLETVRPMLGPDAGRSATETQRADLEAACALLRDLEVDVDGSWRLLRALGGLAQQVDLDAPRFADLLELSEHAQRRAVRLTLAHGLTDPDSWVRAGAFRANFEVFGSRFLMEAILALDPPAPDDQGRLPTTEVFGLYPEVPSDTTVLVAVLGLLREHGLPLDVYEDPLDRRALRFQLLRLLTSIAYELRIFDDRARSAAMQALGEVADSGFHSLRKEDWERWWAAYAPGEAAAIEELGRQRREGATLEAVPDEVPEGAPGAAPDGAPAEADDPGRRP